MTNGWVDIKNADVILAMGGNPAENHPVRLQVVHRGEEDARREARRRRSALHAHGGGRRPLLADPRRHRHRLPPRHHPLRAREQAASTRSTSSSTRTRPTSIGEKFGFDDGLFSGFDDGEAGVRQGQLGLRSRTRRRGVRGRPDARAPALRLPAPEEARRALHAGDGRADLRHAEGDVPEGRRDRHLDRQRRARRHDHYALGWTQHSTGVQMIRAAAMLQLLLGNVGRPGGGVNAFRGHSNIQGATDTAGTFEILPGYLKTPTGHSADARGVPRDEHAHDAQQAGVGLDELLGELPEVHGLAAQGGLRQQRRRRRTSSATPGCPRSTATTPGCTSSTTCTAAARARRRRRSRARRA